MAESDFTCVAVNAATWGFVEFGDVGGAAALRLRRAPVARRRALSSAMSVAEKLVICVAVKAFDLRGVQRRHLVGVERAGGGVGEAADLGYGERRRLRAASSPMSVALRPPIWALVSAAICVVVSAAV